MNLHTTKSTFVVALGAASVLAITTTTSAAYVTPMMGGGQQPADMVMPMVSFDGTNLSTMFMGAETPVLRSLTPPDEFDPAKPESVLSGKAYNSQYGWMLDSTNSQAPSGGTHIWIEQTASTPGLQAYEAGTYDPIFGTAGSSSRWMWALSMVHNWYAVTPGVGTYFADYHLYIGDASGNPLPGYGAADITFNWTSVPEPASLTLLGASSLFLLRRRRRV